ncbi:MAG TPA: hypothetical protein VIV11_34655 [Kofleriaceae bacterium]
MRPYLLVIALTACGSPDGGGGGGDDAPEPDAKQAAHFGAVTITSYAAMAQGTPFQGGAATARFWTDSCAVEVQGECTISDCSTTNWVSAGPITIKTSTGTMMLDPGANNSYPTMSAQAPLYTGGEMIMVSGTGAAVPAFSGTLVAPSKPTLTAPPPGNVIVDRSRDFTFSWSGGGSTDVWITMSATAMPYKAIACTFAASRGQATIPKAVLAALPAGTGSFGLNGYSISKREAGDWEVALQAFYSAVWPDGTLAGGPTTIQ